MKEKFCAITLLLCLLGMQMTSVCAQSSPFQFALEPLEIKDMPGLQSFSFGQYGGEWLLLGGRVDGLHRRQPFASFDSAGHNFQLVVISPMEKQVWTSKLSTLSQGIQEHLSATNQQFYQEGKYLYVSGGYGYSPSLGDHLTYDYFTAIDVVGAIEAVKKQADLSPFFRQISDPRFQVTGGQMGKIEENYYLIGGHNFTGRYNPMGADHGPGFKQQYHEILQQFDIQDDGKILNIEFRAENFDTAHFHRRDYNLVPQINGAQQTLMIFSGVFQTKADIPFLNCTAIESNSVIDCIDFQQHYQQYHCAHIPIYSAESGEMHTVFFGGIGEYYDSAGIHVLDCNVPFTKTIARVTCAQGTQCEEYKLPLEMPDFLGTGAQFVPIQALPLYPNGVLKLDSLLPERQLIGHIVGGIESSGKNIFWVNEGEHSKANTKVYKVFLSQSDTAPADHHNVQSHTKLGLEVLPDPYKALLILDFNHSNNEEIEVRLQNQGGKTILKKQVVPSGNGRQHLVLPCKPLKKGGRFLLHFTVNGTTTELGLVVIL